MSQMLRLLAVLGIFVVGAVAGAAVATGAGPVAAADDVADGVASYTQTATAGGDTADGDSASDGSGTAGTAAPGGSTDGSSGGDAATAPFAFTVDRVESCGTTCRDVTSTLTNRQSTAATDVTVETRIYAGNGTDGDLVWNGTESVGRLDAGESHTTTRRVSVSLTDAYAIERAGGWITVETTVTSDGETMTTTERRQVR